MGMHDLEMGREGVGGGVRVGGELDKAEEDMHHFYCKRSCTGRHTAGACPGGGPKGPGPP